MKKIISLSVLFFLLTSGFWIFTGSITAAKAEASYPYVQNTRADVLTPGKSGILNKGEIIAKTTSIAIPFVKNVGQFNGEVKFAADLLAGRFFLTNKELVYSLRQQRKAKTSKPDKLKFTEKAKEEGIRVKGLSLREYFVDQKGAKIGFGSSGEQQSETAVSYFKGKDPKKWRSAIPSYRGISLGEVYPGIEVKLKASNKNVEKVFYVGPHKSVATIQIAVEGVAGLKIDKDGRLLFKNSLGELALRAPVAWQEIAGKRHEVKVEYCLQNDYLYGFAILNKYDKQFPLIIDPAFDTLMASTFLGGSSWDQAGPPALDKAGNVYVTGETQSMDFPMTLGTFDQNLNDGADVFISKLNSDLTVLLASTFLGGNGNYYEGGRSLALDNAGNVYVTGWTDSSDFPTTPGAYDRTYNGGTYHQDAFVSKLTNDLTTLLASTYLGGNNDDSAYSLALDGANNIYLTGHTGSPDFPTTPGAYDRLDNENDYDIFVSKLNNDLTTLLASTYLGGSSFDRGITLVLDNTGNVYLTGWTGSADFPTTPGAYDQSFIYPDEGGNNMYQDIFVAKMNENLTSLLASTFLSGNGDPFSQPLQRAFSLALDSAGNVFVTGWTSSAVFPTTPGAFDRTFNNGDAFVSKLNSDLATLLASTFLGGGGSEVCLSLALDKTGNVYVTGWTDSADFPTSPGAYDPIYNGSAFGFFVAKINNNLNTLLASTYLGDNIELMPNCFLALDFAGNVFVTGGTRSPDFPTTPGALDRTHNGGSNQSDAFVAKLNGNLIIINDPPQVEIISPENNAQVYGVVTVMANASDDVDIARIEFYVDGALKGQAARSQSAAKKICLASGTSENSRITKKTLIHSADPQLRTKVSSANSQYTFTWNTMDAAAGSHVLRVVAYDEAEAMGADDVTVQVLKVNLELQAERHEVKAFSILRHYGQIQFTVDNPGIPLAQYRLMRRKGNADFALLKAVAPSELQNKQFQMQDKYLEKDIPYTYRAEAYDDFGQLAGRSAEKTI